MGDWRRPSHGRFPRICRQTSAAAASVSPFLSHSFYILGSISYFQGWPTPQPSRPGWRRYAPPSVWLLTLVVPSTRHCRFCPSCLPTVEFHCHTGALFALCARKPNTTTHCLRDLLEWIFSEAWPMAIVLCQKSRVYFAGMGWCRLPATTSSTFLPWQSTHGSWTLLFVIDTNPCSPLTCSEMSLRSIFLPFMKPKVLVHRFCIFGLPT